MDRWPQRFAFDENKDGVALLWFDGYVYAYAKQLDKTRALIFGFKEAMDKAVNGQPEYAALRNNMVAWLSPGKPARIVEASQEYQDGDILYIHQYMYFDHKKATLAINEGRNSFILVYITWHWITEDTRIFSIPFVKKWDYTTIHGAVMTDDFISAKEFLSMESQLGYFVSNWTVFRTIEFPRNLHSQNAAVVKALEKPQVQDGLNRIFDRYGSWLDHNCPCDLKMEKHQHDRRHLWYNYGNLLMGQTGDHIRKMPGIVRHPGDVAPGYRPEVLTVRIIPPHTRTYTPTGAYVKAGMKFSWEIIDHKGAIDDHLRLHIGCTTDKIYRGRDLKRFPHIVHSRQLTKKGSWISPVGGNLYLVPTKAINITIRFENIIRHLWLDRRTSETFSRYDSSKEQYIGIPYTHYNGDSMHCCMPTDLITARTGKEMLTSVEYMDRVVKMCHNYKGSDWNAHREEIFALDIQLMVGDGHSGYPLMGHWYWSGDILKYEEMASFDPSGVIHEIGHNLQMRPATLKNGNEVSNNVYIMLVKSIEFNKPYYEFGHGYALSNSSMTYMVRAWNRREYAYSINYYAYLHHYFGHALTGNTWHKFTTEHILPKDDDAKAKRWQLEVSLKAGYDLVPFHQLYSLPCDDWVVEQLKDLPCFMPDDRLTNLDGATQSLVQQILTEYHAKTGKVCSREPPPKVEFEHDVMAGVNDVRPPYIFHLD